MGIGYRGAITCYSKEGKELSKNEADCYSDITPTNVGRFIAVAVRNIKTLSHPVYISAFWFDTETVITQYDKDYKVEWRKTYDTIKDATGVDVVVPQRDFS